MSHDLNSTSNRPQLGDRLRAAFGRGRPVDSSWSGQMRALLQLLAKFQNAVRGQGPFVLRHSEERLEHFAQEAGKLMQVSERERTVKEMPNLSRRSEDLTAEITAELPVPVREAGVLQALSSFRSHVGQVGEAEARRFEAALAKITQDNSPATKRCSALFQLEREILQRDQPARERAEPGSTWSGSVDAAITSAQPENAKHELQMSREEWQFQADSFVNAKRRKIDEMLFSVPEAAHDEFRQRAEAAVLDIRDDLFSDDRLPVNQAQLGKTLMQAETAALQQLGALKRQYPANPTPQVSVHDGKLSIIKPAPPLKSLVLQGGGGKGIGYPSLLEEMDKSGMLADVDLLVGTSIGALNATCLACGGLDDERELLKIQTFRDGYDAPGLLERAKDRYPGVTFEGGVLPSCAGQMARMDEMVGRSVASGLESYQEDRLRDDLLSRLRTLDQETLARLGLHDADDATLARRVTELARKVKHQDFEAKDRTGYMITFGDLAILHQLDPKQFKELSITGWEGTGLKGKLVYFNAKDFPDMPVAIAARISMGLPILAPLYWNGRGPFYDGGVGSNAPVEAAPGLDKFYEQHQDDPAGAEAALANGDVPWEVQQAMQTTMLLTFDQEGEANKNLYGDGRHQQEVSGGERALVMGDAALAVAPLTNPIDFASRLLSAHPDRNLQQMKDELSINPHYDQALTRDAGKVYNSGVNTLQVYHGDLGTLSMGVLGPNTAEAQYVESLARLKALEQIDQRADQAVALSTDNPLEALGMLSDRDKRNLVQAGRPEGADPLVVGLFDYCVEYLALEELFTEARALGDATSALDRLTESSLVESERTKVHELAALYRALQQPVHDANTLEEAERLLARRIDALPHALAPLLKKNLLIPLQQRLRAVVKSGPAAAPEFVWERQFSLAAWERCWRLIESRKILPSVKSRKSIVSSWRDFEKYSTRLEAIRKPSERVEVAREALTHLEELLRMWRELRVTPDYAASRTLMEYLAWLDAAGHSRQSELLDIVQGARAIFAPRPFVAWDVNAWKKVKKEAIHAGVIEVAKSLDLEEAIELAVEATEEVHQPGKFESLKAALLRRDARKRPDEVDSAGKVAWLAWDAVLKAAEVIQSLTRNTNFRSYLQECIDQARLARDRQPPV